MCECKITELRQREIAGGARIAAVQCLECGRQVEAVKKASLNVRFEDLPLWDGDLAEQARKRSEDEYQQRIKALEDERRARARIENDAWWRDYNAYLKSDKWKRKRAAILERDKGICRACQSRPATQCHHLTYAHVFDEPLFDLVAVCAPCHDKITAMDRERRNA